MTTFWAFMAWVNSLSGTCYAVTQSTHSHPITEQAIMFGGSCRDAFTIALYSHGAIAWVLGS